NPDELEHRLAPLAEALGLDDDESADVVVVTDADALAQLAPQVEAVYTRVSRNGPLSKLPQVGDISSLPGLSQGVADVPAAPRHLHELRAAPTRGESSGVELISVHVPKCAGSSFNRALVAAYGPDDVAFDMEDDVANEDSLFRRDFDEWS